MRISSNQIFLQGVEAFGNQQVKIARLQEQISTGTKLTRPSDDPLASTKVVELEQLVGEQEQYQRNISLAEQRLRLQEGTLQGISNIMQRIRELAIQANSSANSQTSWNAIAAEVRERYEELISAANTIDPNGDFLFAGFQNQSQPFTQVATGTIEHIAFSGDEGQRQIQVSRSRQVNVDINGKDLFLRVASPLGLNEDNTTVNGLTIAPSRVFDQQTYLNQANFSTVSAEYRIDINFAAGTYNVVDVNGVDGPVGGSVGAGTYVAGESIEFNGIRTSITGTLVADTSFTISQGLYRDVFDVLNGFEETLRDSGLSGDQKAANFGQTLADIDSAFGQILDARTAIGGRLNVLETQLSDSEAYVLASRDVLSELRDTDLAEAISQLSLDQTILEAAQGVFSRITRSTLFDFLR